MVKIRIILIYTTKAVSRYADEHHAEFAWLCVCILSHGGITRCGKNEGWFQGHIQEFGGGTFL